MNRANFASRFSPTFWVTAQSAYTQGFGIALFAIQAPILGPRAFGLVSIVMVFTGFCEVVLTEAALDALISVPRIEALHYATMSAVTTLIAGTISAFIVVFAVPIARLFHDAELTPVLRCMAVLPILSAFAAAPNAATKRALQFRPLAMRSIAGTTAGGVVGLILTLLGSGVWALVWQAIVQRLVSVVILWWAVPLKPQLKISRPHLAELATFFGPLFLSRTMRWATGQIPRFILGLYLGAAELGVFSLAARLADILSQLTVVARYVVLRLELRRFLEGPAGLEAAVRDALARMSMLYFPLFVGAAAVIPALFRTWLDPRWFTGIVPAQLMMLMGLPSVSLFAIGGLLMALNFQKAEALLSIVETAATIALVLVAAPFGLLAVTQAYALRPFLTLPLAAGLAKSRCGIPVRTIFFAQLPALIAASCMGAVVLSVGRLLPTRTGAALVLFIEIGAGLASYIGFGALLMPSLARPIANRWLGQLRTLRRKWA